MRVLYAIQGITYLWILWKLYIILFSYLTSIIVVYNGHLRYPSYLEPLYVLQKKAIPIIIFFPPRTPSKPLFSKHNILSLYSIYKFHVACFVFSHFNSLLPTPVSSILHFNSEYHDYMTRSRFNLHKTCHKYQFAITWQAPIIWNDIPLTVRNSLTQEPWWAHTIGNFKRKLRLHFLSTWISLWKTCWRAIELSLNFIRLLRVVITPSVVERRKRLEAIGWISGYIELISLKFLVSLTFLSPILYTLWTILGVFVCMI